MKTSELTGTALNWAVAICEGYNPKDFCLHDKHFRDEEDVWFSPSDDWAQGGPIIEREKIELIPNGEEWDAMQADQHIPNEGPTPLIAAMRCYVAGKLGDDVELPMELTK